MIQDHRQRQIAEPTRVASKPSSATANKIMPFDTKPLNKGTADIEAAPIKQNAAVHGIDLAKPPQLARFSGTDAMQYGTHAHKE